MLVRKALYSHQCGSPQEGAVMGTETQEVCRLPTKVHTLLGMVWSLYSAVGQVCQG